MLNAPQPGARRSVRDAQQINKPIAERVVASSSARRGPGTAAAPGRAPGASGYPGRYRQAQHATFLFSHAGPEGDGKDFPRGPPGRCDALVVFPDAAMFAVSDRSPYSLPRPGCPPSGWSSFARNGLLLTYAPNVSDWHATWTASCVAQNPPTSPSNCQPGLSSLSTSTPRGARPHHAPDAARPGERGDRVARRPARSACAPRSGPANSSLRWRGELATRGRRINRRRRDPPHTCVVVPLTNPWPEPWEM